MRKLLIKTLFAGSVAASLVACGAENAIAPPKSNVSASCPGIDLGPAPASLSLPVSAPKAMPILGSGLDTMRYQAEIAVRGATAYTTTWNVRNGIPGNKINIWDVSGPSPVLVDSSIITGVITTGDVAVSDDGKLLVVATEYLGGSIAVYDLTNPRNPQLLSRFSNDLTQPGVHTAEIGRVNGTLYAFLAIDPSGSIPARMVIVDLSNPSSPQQVYTKVTGNPFVHDSFLRDGLLFVALWNDGLEIWDVGGVRHRRVALEPDCPRQCQNGERRGTQRLVVPRSERVEAVRVRRRGGRRYGRHAAPAAISTSSTSAI